MVAKQQRAKRARKPRKQARKKVYKLEPYERYRTISGAPTAADILALQQAQMAQQSALNTQANLTAERVRQEYETERRRQQQQEQQAQQVGILEALNQRIGQREAEQDTIMQRLDRGERYIAPRFNLIDEYGQRLRALEQQQQEQEHQRYREYYDATHRQIDDDTTISGIYELEDDNDSIQSSAPSSTYAFSSASSSAPSSTYAFSSESSSGSKQQKRRQKSDEHFEYIVPELASAAPAPAAASKPKRDTIQPGHDFSVMTDAELNKARRNVQTRTARGSIEARARAAQVIKEIDTERAKRLNVQVDDDDDDNFDA